MAKSRIDQTLRLCIDRVIPDEDHPARAAAARAILELATPAVAAPAAAMMSPMLGITGNRGGGGAEAAALAPIFRMAIDRFKMWENGRALNCRFLDGSDTQ